ncbi:MAG: Tfp pilus assembly protein FimT/FimU [Blautia wexlerae]
MRQKNKGFTLIEMVITVAIFAILLGILVPSLNSILGFRAQRAANSIASALDKTKIEASNRLVGEMKLEKLDDGYYISYYLDRGKVGTESNVEQDQAEKIAPARTLISYVTDNNETYQMETGDSIVLTYDRATGGFLPLQETTWTQKAILAELDAGKDIPLTREGSYCTAIIVQGGRRIKTINMDINTGKYEITSSWAS